MKFDQEDVAVSTVEQNQQVVPRDRVKYQPVETKIEIWRINLNFSSPSD